MRHRFFRVLLIALSAMLGMVACDESVPDRGELVGRAVQAMTTTCDHELTCSGGPLSGGSGPAAGCIPPSGNANGYCVHEVCADPGHAYCCTAFWDNGCAQFASSRTTASGFKYDDCPTAPTDPVPACAGSSCIPLTCLAKGATCGSIADGCGCVLTCGVCPNGQTCTNNTCGSGTNPGPGTCVHDLTCTALALSSTCDNGTKIAGCVAAICTYPGTAHCCSNTVPAGQQAVWDASCVAELHWQGVCGIRTPPPDPAACGTGSSSGPALCLAANANCGTISDGQGGTVNCGSCDAPQTCGGAGAANQCGCKVMACPAGGAGDSCGAVPDGCGGTVNCGSCPTGQTCSSSNTCQASSGSIALPSPTLAVVRLATLSFGMLGDTRPAGTTSSGYPQNLKTVIGSIFAGLEAQGVPLAVDAGDYAFAASTAGSAVPQFTDFMTARQNFRGTFLPTIGNHECTTATTSNCPAGAYSGTAQDYLNMIVTPSTGQSSPYFSALYLAIDGSWSAKFVMVAANAWDGAQKAWLSETLATKTTYTFVVRHEPGNATTAPGTIPSETLMAAAFSAGSLTLSITGHTHLVQLPGGTQPYGNRYGATQPYEMIVGNGGAPLDAGSYYGYAVATRRASDGAIVTQMFESADSSSKVILPNIPDPKFRFAVNGDGTPNLSITLP